MKQVNAAIHAAEAAAKAAAESQVLESYRIAWLHIIKHDEMRE